MLNFFENEYAHIWPQNATQYKAGILIHTRANKVCKLLGDPRRFKKGEECLIKFFPKDLEAVLKILDMRLEDAIPDYLST